MAIATVTFRRCVQNARDAGSDGQQVASRIYFDLDLDGHRHTDVTLDIKHPLGKIAPLEVSRPHGYTGPGEFDELRDAAAAYYRKVAGHLAKSRQPAPDTVIVQDDAVKFDV